MLFGRLLIFSKSTFLKNSFRNTDRVSISLDSDQARHFVRNSEYDQELPQSQTADNLVAPRGRAAQPSQDTRKTN